MTMIDSLGMHSRFSVVFFIIIIIILWRWKEEGKKDAEIFHHRFFCLVQHSFVLLFTKGQVLRKVPLPAYSSKRESSLPCLCVHTCICGRSGRKWRVRVWVERNTSSHTFSHALFNRRGKYGTQPWTCVYLWPWTPQICVLNRTGQLSAMENHLDFQVWVEWRSGRDSGVKIQRQIIESPNSSWPLGYSHCWDIHNQSERNHRLKTASNMVGIQNEEEEWSEYCVLGNVLNKRLGKLFWDQVFCIQCLPMVLLLQRVPREKRRGTLFCR